MNIDIAEAVKRELNGEASPEESAWLESHAEEWWQELGNVKRDIETQMAEREAGLLQARNECWKQADGAVRFNQIKAEYLGWRAKANRKKSYVEQRLSYVKPMRQQQREAREREAGGGFRSRMDDRMTELEGRLFRLETLVMDMVAAGEPAERTGIRT